MAVPGPQRKRNAAATSIHTSRDEVLPGPSADLATTTKQLALPIGRPGKRSRVIVLPSCGLSYAAISCAGRVQTTASAIAPPLPSTGHTLSLVERAYTTWSVMGALLFSSTPLVQSTVAENTVAPISAVSNVAVRFVTIAGGRMRRICTALGGLSSVSRSPSRPLTRVATVVTVKVATTLIGNAAITPK